MTKYYKGKNTKNVFISNSKKPFRLSRSKIELFVKCPRCFFIDRKLGIGHPPSYPYSLNSAVDVLLKCEFDEYRKKGEPHPLMVKFGIAAAPLSHEKMDEWRDSLTRGIRFVHPKTNFEVAGPKDRVH